MKIKNKIFVLCISLLFSANIFADESPTLRVQIKNIYEQGTLPKEGLKLNTGKLGYKCIMSDGKTKFSIKPDFYKLLISEAQPALPNNGPLQPGRAATPAKYSEPVEILSFNTNYSDSVFSFSAATPILGLNSIIVSTSNKTERPESIINTKEQAVQTILTGSDYYDLSAIFSIKEFFDQSSSKNLLALQVEWSVAASRCEIQCSEPFDYDVCSQCESENPLKRIKSYQDYGYCWQP